MARGSVGYGAAKIVRSIHRWIHTSIGNTPLPISPFREPRKGPKDERNSEGGRKESPEEPLVVQLSHLPIGPSHVLICLLVNPPVSSHPSSLIGYFALPTFVEPLCFFPLLPFSILFFLLLSLCEGSLPFLFRSLSFRSARTESRRRSLQNEFDRH